MLHLYKTAKYGLRSTCQIHSYISKGLQDNVTLGRRNNFKNQSRNQYINRATEQSLQLWHLKKIKQPQKRCLK